MLVKANMSGGGGGYTDYDFVRVTKSRGNTSLSIPTSKKATNFVLCGASGTALAYTPDKANTLDYYYASSGILPITDTYNPTVQFTDTSIELGAFYLSSASQAFVVFVMY